MQTSDVCNSGWRQRRFNSGACCWQQASIAIQLKITLLEQGPAPEPTAPLLQRVSALNQASKRLLSALRRLARLNGQSGLSADGRVGSRQFCPHSV